jgi:uncharacterized caspase-like protein
LQGASLSWATIGLGLTLLACRGAGDVAPSVGAGAEGIPARALWDGRDRRIALVIGHDRGGLTRQPLRYAQTDAARMAAALQELGGFTAADVHLLEGPALADVRAALARMAVQVRAFRAEGAARGTPGRALVLVYFSGHSDGRVLELGREVLPFAELRAAIEALGPDLRVVVLDACRSGSLLASKGGGVDFSLEPALESTSGEVMLTSSGAAEDALESEELRASFFSHHLLSGMRGAADVNQDGRVTLSEAFQHAAGRTTSETAGTILGPQHPRYQTRLTGRADLVLTQIPRARAAIEIAAAIDRALLVDALSGAVAAEWTAGAGARLAVTPGPYLVHAFRGGARATARFTLPPGESRRVTDAMLVPSAPPAAPTSPPETPTLAAPAPPARPLSEAAIRRAFAEDATCVHRCLLDLRSDRHDCRGPITLVTNDPGRITLMVDVPRAQQLVRVRFEVCDPEGLWLDVADSPGGDGGGGDDGQFSNDAELELRNTGIYLLTSDYGRDSRGNVGVVTSRPDFVKSRGCSQRTLALGDQLLRSHTPAVVARSPYGLRLDPARDDEGAPDRRWFFGLNRSVGSAAPTRSGRGLDWIELCVR